MVDKHTVERSIREATINAQNAANQVLTLEYESGDQPPLAMRYAHRAILQGIAAQLDQISLMYGDPPPDRTVK